MGVSRVSREARGACGGESGEMTHIPAQNTQLLALALQVLGQMLLHSPANQQVTSLSLHQQPRTEMKALSTDTSSTGDQAPPPTGVWVPSIKARLKNGLN